MRRTLMLTLALGCAFAAAAAPQTEEEKAAARKAAAERRAAISAQEKRVNELWKRFADASERVRRKQGESERARNDLNASSNAWKAVGRKIDHLGKRLKEISTVTIPRQTAREQDLGRHVRGAEKTAKTNDRALQVRKFDNAAQAQRDVLAKMGKLRELIESEQPELQKISSPQHVENELVRKKSAEMAMADAYELARKLEEAITESFKDLKATQTAISRKMSYQAAQRITDVARTERREANREVLEAKARTKEALDAQKQEQVEVVREAQNIVDTSVQMMKEAMDIVMKKDDSADRRQEGADEVKWLTEEDFKLRESEEERKRRLEEMASDAEYQLELQKAAAEDEQDRAKDMASLMSSVAVNETSAPPSLRADAKDLLPGNRMSVSGREGDGIPARWMYVNSWYVIGPFPNPDRVNLRRKFPPESVIDLDASYPGADGKMVSWRFMQTRNSTRNVYYRADVVPNGWMEYVIWYAYAEVFFDEDCDRWLAVGSDDRSDLWVNQMPVWGSSNRLKKWNIGEGFRRVHFKKGRNELLIRVENGHHFCNWSVCIATDDDAR